ncbi:MAG: hypothetical protein OXN97_05030 [Bryobacterales bacterium]|nr:hypothetical protein [Bryobacterales bacterium]MDE0629642.1 hypothetical protein [Bryobacterales bacterium]
MWKKSMASAMAFSIRVRRAQRSMRDGCLELVGEERGMQAGNGTWPYRANAIAWQ